MFSRALHTLRWNGVAATGGSVERLIADDVGLGQTIEAGLTAVLTQGAFPFQTLHPLPEAVLLLDANGAHRDGRHLQTVEEHVAQQVAPPGTEVTFSPSRAVKRPGTLYVCPTAGKVLLNGAITHHPGPTIQLDIPLEGGVAGVHHRHQPQALGVVGDDENIQGTGQPRGHPRARHHLYTAG